MGNYLEQYLNSIEASAVTEFFLISLVSMFVIALGAALIKKAPRFVTYAPNMLTSIGILGTFIGIVVGLLAFDVADINGSIGGLLSGLKTAFITSLAGMGLSIAFKIISTFPFMQTSGKTGSRDTIGADLLASMQKQNEQLDILKEAIAGDEESSLAGQMKLARTNAHDHHAEQKRVLMENNLALKAIQGTAENQHHKFNEFTDSLWQQLEKFSEMLSKSATEQVINALNEVIADFNRNLTEQFGENFKALDSSVKKLVTWQEQYSVQLEKMGEQYQQGVEAITQTEASVAHISEESRHIPDTMGQLKVVMEVNQHQIQELDRHLEGFRDIRDKAVEAVPEIRQQVENTVIDIKDAAVAASEHHNKLLESSDQYIKEHNEATRDLLTEYVDKTKEGLGIVRDNLDKGASAIAEALTESADKVRTSIAAGAEKFDDKVESLSANLISTSDVLAEKSTAIRDQLGDTVKDINDHSKDMVTQLIEGNSSMANILTQSGNDLNDSLKKTVQQVSEDSFDLQRQVASAIEQMQTRLESVLEAVFQTQTQKMDKFSSGVEQAMQAAVDRTGEGVNAQLKLIDSAMQKEIERIMTEMGTALASISGQFTHDYRGLVGAMNDVVRQGRAA